MKKHIKILAFFFSMTALLSCKKNEVIPAVVKEDLISENTAGISAKVNESIFSSAVNRADSSSVDTTQSSPFYATYGSDSSSLIILGNGKLNDQDDSVNWAQILLWVTRFNGADTYSIDDGSSLAVFSVVDTSNNLRQFFSSGSPNGNVIINQFDTINNTISVTFQFRALSNDSVIVVKNGVFHSVKIH